MRVQAKEWTKCASVFRASVLAPIQNEFLILAQGFKACILQAPPRVFSLSHDCYTAGGNDRRPGNNGLANEAA